MKKITIIALSTLIMAACQKEINEKHPDIRLKNDLVAKKEKEKERVTRPMKINFYSSVNEASPNLTCTLPGVPFAIANSGYFLHGNATHLGKIDAEKSIGQDGFCNLNAAFILTTKTSGRIVAANGDAITYSGDDSIDLNNVIRNAGSTATITGLWKITGGTGKFKGASGSFSINGFVDVTTTGGPTFTITGEGTITY